MLLKRSRSRRGEADAMHTDPHIDEKIHSLKSQVGDLREEVEALRACGVDIDKLPFINVGDLVSFHVSVNSMYQYQKLRGIVVANRKRDKGHYYAYIREENSKIYFYKKQTDLTRIRVSEKVDLT